MKIAKLLCGVFGIAFSLISAYFWYKASVVKITEVNNIHDPGVELRYEDPKDPDKEIHVVATAMEQSRLNKIAAMFTALAVLTQAMATIIPTE
ncbi:MAG: hypothetical protein ACKVQW_07495 [Pyrinomonadaceae bacterium]